MSRQDQSRNTGGLAPNHIKVLGRQYSVYVIDENHETYRLPAEVAPAPPAEVAPAPPDVCDLTWSPPVSREASPVPVRDVPREPSPELLVSPKASRAGSPADYGEMEVVTDDDQPTQADAVKDPSALDALMDYDSESSNASPIPSRTASAASCTLETESDVPIERTPSTESEKAPAPAALIFRQASRCLSMAVRNVPVPPAIVAEEAGAAGEAAGEAGAAVEAGATEVAVEAAEDEAEVDWNLPKDVPGIAMTLEALIQYMLTVKELFPKAKACLTNITELLRKRTRGVSVKFASALRDMVETIKQAEAQRPDIAAWWQDEVKNLAAIMEKKAHHLTGKRPAPAAPKVAGSDQTPAKKSKKDPPAKKSKKDPPAKKSKKDLPAKKSKKDTSAKKSKKAQPEPQIMVRMFSHHDEDSDDEVTSLEFDIMEEGDVVNKLLPDFDMEQREALLACKFESFLDLQDLLSKDKLAQKIKRVVGMLALLSKFGEHEPKEIELEIPNAGEDFQDWIKRLYTVNEVIYEDQLMTFLKLLNYFGPSLEAYELLFDSIFEMLMSYMTPEDFILGMLGSELKMIAQTVASDFAWLFFVFANDNKVNIDKPENKETSQEELKIIVQAFESPIGLRHACGFDDMAEDQTFIVNPSAMVSNLAEYKAKLA